MARSNLPGVLLVIGVATGVLGTTDRGRAQDIVISELVAANASGLTDEDGSRPDWIEILNATDNALDLDGWYLTDDPGDFTKWRFPPIVVEPKAHVLVFASEKNRAVAGAELHTSFKLDGDGEFLALIRPDGVSVASMFLPYPPQIPDVSYGIALDASFRRLVDPGAGAKVLIPAEADAALEWTGRGFDDTGWLAGEIGLGYDRRSTPVFGADVIRMNLEERMYRVNSSAYIRIPFEVEDASSVTNLRLRMKFDDGFVAYLNGTEAVRANAPDELTWDARSSLRRTETDALTWAAYDISSHATLLANGTNVLAVHGLNDTRTSTDFLVVAELSGGSVQGVRPSELLYFEDTTPAFPNVAGFAGLSPAPAIDQEDAAFVQPFDVTITTDAPDSVIRYTLDGTTPTASSPAYEGPVRVAESTTLSARVFQSGNAPGPTVRRTFVQVDPAVAEFTSDLPVMAAHASRAIVDSVFTPLHLQIYDVVGDASRVGANIDFAGRGGIKLRGSSSLGFEKKNYGLEIWDEHDGDLDVPLLGMPADSDWTLHGPYSDKSLMRNALSYKWSNDIGAYATRTRFVELFVNQRAGTPVTMASYVGVYLLTEKIKRGPERVDIEPLYPSQNEEPEITGGYILKNDRLDPGDSGLRTARGKLLAWVEPKESEVSPEQRAWLIGFLNEFEVALYGPDFADPEVGYEKYIDVDSFIDHHIIVELTKNIDGYRLSTFMYKDRGGKLRMGPVWDYNLSLGNADYNAGWQPSGWYYSIYQNSYQEYPWYPRLFQDAAFQRRYAERWLEHRQEGLAMENLLGSISDYAAELENAQARNFQRFRILGTRIWPNWYIARTWQDEVAWMTDWLVDRVTWMDSQFLEPPVFSQYGGEIGDSLDLEITSIGEGVVFYTLDGSDPLGDDDMPATSAREYSGPITLTDTVVVTARTRYQNNLWSPSVAAVFVKEIPTIVISELMYSPLPPPEESPFSTSNFEYVEFYNFGSEPIRVHFLDMQTGVRFQFITSPHETLEPGEYAVVVNDREAFVSRYGEEGSKILGEYTGSLSNRGENVAFTGPIDPDITDFPYVEFRYEGDWFPTADGTGPSIVIKDPTAPRRSWNDAESWRSSSEPLGSPGRADGPVSEEGRIRPGDLTPDGRLDLADALTLLNHLFPDAGAPLLPCGSDVTPGSANHALIDVNGDATANLADGLYLLNYLFLEGPAPALGTDCVTLESCRAACP